MSSCHEHLTPRRRPARWLAAGALWLAAGAALAQASVPVYVGVGRPATPKEVAAWDTDVRPDFKGLPRGQGSVAQGQDVWETKCASCHGVFGESNEVFSPLVGGTTANDVKNGRVAKLLDNSFPGRTTLMKVPTVSTLWDYIHRAMPWNMPKSLQPDEVYAVTAFLLNLGGVVPDNFVLSDKTMAEAQARLPNRHGMRSQHGLWPGKGLGNGGKPDAQGSACMSQCSTEAKVASFLPDFARNAHGNLAEQNRLVGPQRGADTTRPAAAATGAQGGAAAAVATVAAVAAAPALTMPSALLNKNACTACHAVASKLVGPSFKDIAAKHGSRSDATAYLASRIKAGSVGVWGQVPMPPQALSEEDARTIGQWLAAGAKP